MVFVDGLRMRLLATDFHCSLTAVRKRLRYSLTRLTQQSLSDHVPDGDLILVVDGLWFSFQRKIWVLYDMVVRPVADDVAFVLDPLLRQGKETAPGWQQAFATIPDRIRRRVRVLVSDGFPGSKAITRENRWIQQRCHFHVLSQLYNRLGIRKPALPGRKIRLAMFAAVRVALRTRSADRLTRATTKLGRLAEYPACPPRVAGIAREFLRDLNLYRAYRLHPDLRLPRTISAVESLHGRLRTVASCVNNPAAMLRRVRGVIRLYPTIGCKPGMYQQI